LSFARELHGAQVDILGDDYVDGHRFRVHQAVGHYRYPILSEAPLSITAWGTPRQHLNSCWSLPEGHVPSPWARQVGEGERAHLAFIRYRDEPASTRSIAKTGRVVCGSSKVAYTWSSKHRWRARAAAWDEERDRAACEAHLDAIKQVNREQFEVGEAMFESVRQEIDAAARSLARSANALALWAQTAAKLTRDALGISKPDRRVVVAGDAGAPVQHELAGIIAHLPPATVLQARDVAIEVAKAKARRSILEAGVPDVGTSGS